MLRCCARCTDPPSRRKLLAVFCRARRAALSLAVATASVIWAGSLSPRAAHGAIAAGPAPDGGNVRVSTHDFYPADPFFSQVGQPADVLQQRESSLAVDPFNPNLVAIGMNDIRTFSVNGSGWQSLAVSTNGGRSFDSEALVPGCPGDTSPEGLASPIHGNLLATDPWLSFDNSGHLYFAFIAFQPAPPGKPEFDPQDRRAIAVARYRVDGNRVIYERTVVVEQGTVGIGRQPDKDAMAVDNSSTSPFQGRVYVSWSRFTGEQSHLKVARSVDHGGSYLLADVGVANDMQGTNLAVAPNGDVYLSWRTFGKTTRPSVAEGAALFVARSTDGGATFGPAVQVAGFTDYVQPASQSPPAFRTFSMTSLAADENGVYVAWQQKNPGTGADVMVSRSTDSGATWEAPVSPHSPEGARRGHQFMPSLAAAGGILSAIWYDSRSEPAFNPEGPVTGQSPPGALDGQGSSGLEVFYSQADTCERGPLAFGPELRVTSQPFNPNLSTSVSATSPFIGDYIALATSNDAAYVAWTDNRDVNPSANALEGTGADPVALINVRSRDENIYFQRLWK